MTLGILRTFCADFLVQLESSHFEQLERAVCVQQEPVAQPHGRSESKFKTIYVLDIPDDYPFMDDELVELIKSAAEPIIAAMSRS